MICGQGWFDEPAHHGPWTSVAYVEVDETCFPSPWFTGWLLQGGGV